MRHLLKIPFLIGAFLVSKQAMAYPDFIGYGYSSCITCHYNGLGGGALNDYGRALFATEITSRSVYPASMDEEAIGASSGFLITQPLPWYFRPGIKYRGLYFQQNPNGSNEVNKWVNMQRDFNLNFFFDKKQNLALITTASYADFDIPETTIDKWTMYAKEFYLRYKQSNNLWWYAGQMDKAYGIRNVDHTAVNRFPATDVGLNQYGQTLGVMAHFTYPTWDIAVNPFFGNVYTVPEKRQKGFSVVGEYQVYEKFKVGGSVLASESDETRWRLAGATARWGLSKGSSLLAEAGLKEQTRKGSNSDPVLGSYAWVQSMVAIARGYNILTTIEQSRDDIQSSSAENLKYSFGLLAFPLPRTEFRLGLSNGKTNLDGTGVDDSWALQTQVHLSY
ncbi:hypothetical protein [Bdellovibrio sp. ZAP7]|uniref:hypothetical protein n=1 Tax=Bdellovibrio sp. ZAP7 TaxID=2231053 RepID=UPI001FEE8A88|nr:hypothetical protein [Bdellovibrio sp. ZAP7]